MPNDVGVFTTKGNKQDMKRPDKLSKAREWTKAKKRYPKNHFDKCQWTIKYNTRIALGAVVIILKKTLWGIKKWMKSMS
jgi:hypothetical protein